jgi:hypothetical protein
MLLPLVAYFVWCKVFVLARLPCMYESATFWVTVVATLVAVASLLCSLVALVIARRVAEHERTVWTQRMWFDLFDAAEDFRLLLEIFQVKYDKVLATREFESDAHGLTSASRRMLRFASVFPKNPTIDALFTCVGKWKLAGDNFFSKKMAADYDDAIEELRQRARVPAEVVHNNKMR